MNWLRSLIRKWLGIDELEARMVDIERHFVTKRDVKTGEVQETLADIPVGERKKRRTLHMRGMTIQQRREMMEATDGGRNLG